MPEKTTQERIDQNRRAQDVIDRDPEEARDKLAPHVTVDASADQLTVRDVLGLFMQLQKQTNEMQQRQAEQQDALLRVLTNQQEQQGRTKADTQKELEQAALQQRLTLESWDTEPREPVYLTPEVAEEKHRAVYNLYPPRVFRINGLEFPINVGEVVNVPQSVAALVRHSQHQKAHRIYKPAQDTESIPRPQHVQFLAGSNDIAVGQAGVAGEGRVRPTFAASSPDQAQPLDVRYDAWGH